MTKITLVGSSRFKETWEDWNFGLTCAGLLVYTMGGFARISSDIGKDSNVLMSDQTKMLVDLVHLYKIDESDAIVILNVDGYIGDSSKREIAWARMKKKRILWLNNSVIGQGFLGETVWSLYGSNGEPIASSASPWLDKYLK